MRKTLKCMAIAAALVSGEFLISTAFSFPTTPSVSVQLTLPHANLDLTDLDVRDNLNRPVKSHKAKQQIRSLFINNLHQLLVANLTPYKRIQMIMLNKIWDVASGWLKRTTYSAFGDIDSWLQKKKTLRTHFFVLSVRSINPQNFIVSQFDVPEATRFLYFLNSTLSSTLLLL